MNSQLKAFARINFSEEWDKKYFLFLWVFWFGSVGTYELHIEYQSTALYMCTFLAKSKYHCWRRQVYRQLEDKPNTMNSQLNSLFWRKFSREQAKKIFPSFFVFWLGSGSTYELYIEYQSTMLYMCTCLETSRYHRWSIQVYRQLKRERHTMNSQLSTLFWAKFSQGQH